MIFKVKDLRAALEHADDDDEVIVHGSFINGPLQHAHAADRDIISTYTWKGRQVSQIGSSHCLPMKMVFIIYA